MFKRVFIANRGEICRRIAESARLLGMETVCVSPSPQPPVYLRRWIDVFLFEEEVSSVLYLDGERMIALAKKAGCDSLHPGFGFLSENASFARRVAESGLCWVGPRWQAVAAMADKADARTLAQSLNVPCTKGLEGLELAQAGSREKVLAFAQDCGYPLLIKATKGGGGKGMRLVYGPEALQENLERASSEALHAFGDGSLIVEQYVEKARHVEVQILADKSGQTFAIGDRDCSLQRRHQKIIEEAPAPFLRASTRQQLHAAAIRLAKEVGYDSAGTVEFLVDVDAELAGKERSFYFLEMNTRLQVEHPVTEEVFGLDIVAWQFRLAGGESLPAAFSSLLPKGHAVEARLYAENPAEKFFPSPGRVRAFRPYWGRSLRWEVGIDPQDEISPAYDPMIAKVIAHGETRAEALKRLGFALDRTLFWGAENNREFLSLLCQNTSFRHQACDTHFIEQQRERLVSEWSERKQSQQQEADMILDFLVQARPLLAMNELRWQTQLDIADITRAAFTNQKLASSKEASPSLASGVSGITSPVTIQLLERNRFETQSREERAARASCYWGLGEVQRCGFSAQPFTYGLQWDSKEEAYFVLWQGFSYERLVAKGGALAEAGLGGGGGETNICAPVPGQVVRVVIGAGEKVLAGQGLFVLESMKMEFEIKAEVSGQVEAVWVQTGTQVVAGQTLASLVELIEGE